jgi:methylthioribose-1-phosphate isomerase
LLVGPGAMGSIARLGGGSLELTLLDVGQGQAACLTTPSGHRIPLEERAPTEVTHPTNESQITPMGVAVYNYAFDITPNKLITALISDQGIITPPYTENILKVISGKA